MLPSHFHSFRALLYQARKVPLSHNLWAGILLGLFLENLANSWSRWGTDSFLYR